MPESSEPERIRFGKVRENPYFIRGRAMMLEHLHEHPMTCKCMDGSAKARAAERERPEPRVRKDIDG